MASSETTDTFPDVAKVSLGLLIGIGLLRTVALLVTDGLTWAGFSIAGSSRPLTLAVAGEKVWIVAIDVLTVLLVVRMLRREDRLLRPLLSPRPVVRTALQTLGALVTVFLAYAVGSYAGNLLIYYGSRTISTGVAAPLWVGLVRMVVTPITLAVAEETLFRGYLLPRLVPHLGKLGAVLVAALLAASQSLALGLGSVEEVLAGFIGAFVVSTALGALYLWFKKLLPLIIVHWLFEALTGFTIFWAALHA